VRVHPLCANNKVPLEPFEVAGRYRVDIRFSNGQVSPPSIDYTSYPETGTNVADKYGRDQDLLEIYEGATDRGVSAALFLRTRCLTRVRGEFSVISTSFDG
jgi:hypothetical protein